MKRHKRRVTILGVMVLITAFILLSRVVINVLEPRHDTKLPTIYNKYRLHRLNEEDLRDTYRQIDFHKNNGHYVLSKLALRDLDAADVKWLTNRYKRGR